MELSDTISLIKPVGLTPLAAMDKLRERMPGLAQVKMGYAGRLDPMADGVLLVLVGNANSKRKEYERLPKVYSFNFVCGICTDTYDMLGLAEPGNIPAFTTIHQHLARCVTQFTGTFRQEYPPYSAVRVNGKSLFAWARLGKLPQPMPSKNVTVTEFSVDNITTITATDLLARITENVGMVHGDFRQEHIVSRWQQLLAKNDTVYPRVACTVKCSSGVYIRGLVHAIGRELNTGAFATGITRTQIGTYTINNAVKL